MLEAINENIIGIMCTFFMTGAAGIITHLFRQFQGLSQAVMAINHDRLYQACTFFILTGEITIDELKTLSISMRGITFWAETEQEQSYMRSAKICRL